METLDIKIALDPVNDGAVLKETKLKRKDEGALIIATNGESRIVDAYEAQEILDKLNDIGHGEYMERIRAEIREEILECLEMNCRGGE